MTENQSETQTEENQIELTPAEEEEILRKRQVERDNGRRIVSFSFTMNLPMKFFAELYNVLPYDAELICCYDDIYKRTNVFIIKSMSYPVLEQGCSAPEISALITEEPLGEYNVKIQYPKEFEWAST